MHKFKCLGFLSRLDGFVIMYFNLIKTAPKPLTFLKMLIFAFLNPKNCEVIENFSKARLNFSPFKCTYLGENSFQYHKHLD